MTTASTSTIRTGCQEPTWRHVLPYSETLAPKAALFAEREMGIRLDPWQMAVLSDWMAVEESIGPNGEPMKRWVHRRNGLELPRQQGKTVLSDIRICWGAAVRGELILYTAHDYATVTRLFDRLLAYFGRKPGDPHAKSRRLNAKLRSVRRANGKEAIFLKNGGAIYLSTRTKSARRGYTVDVVVIDEAQEMQEVHAKALLATAASAPLGNPQNFMLGTPPGPECLGENFAEIREKTRAGIDADDISWNEWGVDEVGDIYDDDRIYRTNPALGRRITIEYIRSERATFKDALSFAQERLGYFLEKKRRAAVIKPAEWETCATDEPPEGGGRGQKTPKGTRVAYGVKLSADGTNGALSACIMPEGGVPYVELIAEFCPKDGTAWLTEWIMSQRRCAACVVIDGKGLAQAIVKELLQLGFPKRRLIVPTTAQAVEAYALAVSAVTNGAIAHSGQVPLAVSATKTERREIGKDGGFGFASTDEAAAEPIESASLAHWGAKTARTHVTTGVAY